MGFGSSLGLALELEGNETIAPEEYFSSVRVGVKGRVSFGVGGQFPFGAIVLEPAISYVSESYQKQPLVVFLKKKCS